MIAAAHSPTPAESTLIIFTRWHLAELPAAFAPFQRYQPGFPPYKNVNSADVSLPSACRFSGNIAQIATTATFEH